MNGDLRLEAAATRCRGGGKILVTRLRFIGDVVLSLPLVQALRQAFPTAELHYLAEPGPLEILRAHPDVDRLWCVERTLRSNLQVAARLRRERFDVVIDLLANPRSALLTWATSAPLRIGEARRHRRHLYTHARRLPLGRSALAQHLDAAALLGIGPLVPERPRVVLTPAETAGPAAELARIAAGRKTVLMHWTATQPAKEWPQTARAELARRLQAHGLHVVVSTAPQGREHSAALAAAVPGVQELPMLPLRQLLAWIAAADATVAVDGGIVHASVGLGRPTLALFGPTSPSIWFPYAPFGPFRVLHAGWDCSRCDRTQCVTQACMAQLEVEDVESNLLQLVHGVSVPRECAS